MSTSLASRFIALTMAFSLAFPAPLLAQSDDVPADRVALPSSGGTAALNLPDLGEPADNALTPAQEYAIGQDVVSQMLQYDYILEDPEITEYLQSVVWKLAAASVNKPPHLDIFMVKDTRINAFALPGGFIGVNAGLLMASRNESELAGVLGHEMAHITQRHIARSQNQSSGASGLAMLGLMLAAVIAGSADPDLVLGGMAIGQGIMYQKQVSYTRSNEEEADRIGIHTMADAGFDPNAMATFFSRLEQQSRLYGANVPDILLTHPVNSFRVAEAQARAATFPQHAHIDSPEYALMRARARALTVSRPGEATEYFGGQVDAGRDTMENRYGLAVAQRQMGQTDEALKTLEPLIKKAPDQINLRLMQARLLTDKKEFAQAEAIQKTVLSHYPRLGPALIEAAQTMIAAGKPDQARALILNANPAYDYPTELYQLLSQAASDSGNAGEAAFQMAQYYVARGDARSALLRLDAGLREDKLSDSDRQRLRARREELRNQLPKNYNPYRSSS